MLIPHSLDMDWRTVAGIRDHLDRCKVALPFLAEVRIAKRSPGVVSNHPALP
jgi:hypothetical protein